ERTLLAPPRSQVGPVTAQEREKIIGRSPFKAAYDNAVDRESAYELLNERQEAVMQRREEQARREAAEKEARRTGHSSGSRRESPGQAFVKSVARAVGSSLGRQIMRGILGSIIGGRR
ncbi:MAG: DUF853 domain-containing protein, partial [Gammaproteobacteria bacterium]|nr:DUF853 domain-containing protein [Gammaproteobacteria bacterium]